MAFRKTGFLENRIFSNGILDKSEAVTIRSGQREPMRNTTILTLPRTPHFPSKLHYSP
jgi:hypothetical protein